MRRELRPRIRFCLRLFPHALFACSVLLSAEVRLRARLLMVETQEVEQAGF
jgi:hypothetical protein